MLGLNFLPKAAGHAASGAALDLDLIDNHPTPAQISDMQEGMLMDATLQALLRGHARVSVGGNCGAMEAVIPQTKQTGQFVQDGLRQHVPWRVYRGGQRPDAFKAASGTPQDP